MIKSIGYTNDEVINNIIKLYIPDNQFGLDVTFSRGIFYKNIPLPKVYCDKFPQVYGTIPADFHHLPFKANVFNSVMFDPPFVIGMPNKSRFMAGSNLIRNRFGSYKTKSDLINSYDTALAEIARVLKPGGTLVFKCQDTVSGGKQHLIHCDIYNMLCKYNYIVADLFILIAKSRMSSGKWKRQQHARKFHSYFYVAHKPGVKNV